MKTLRQFAIRRWAAFTLVELLVSTAIIALLMLVLVAMTNQTAQTWRYTTEKIEKFQEARDGFEAMTRQISQATLNTYWDYLGVVTTAPAGSVKNNSLLPLPRSNTVSTTDYRAFVPTTYGRMSELRFMSGPIALGASVPSGLPVIPLLTGGASGAVPLGTGGFTNMHGIFFQAPLGVVENTAANRTTYGNMYGAMDNLLNTWGYFLEVNYDTNRPAFVDTVTPKRWRSRLMEFRQASDKMSVYDVDTTSTNNDVLRQWFSAGMSSAAPPTRVLAENIVALVIWPKLAKTEEDTRRDSGMSVLSPYYSYDSTQTLNPGALTKNPITTAAGVAEAAAINPKHQLPPIVQVTMVAIDERSASRLADALKGVKDPTLGLTTKDLFLEGCKPGTKSTAVTQYEKDLATLEQRLVDKKLTYRIFSTNVSIRGSKWSRSQTQ